MKTKVIYFYLFLLFFNIFDEQIFAQYSLLKVEGRNIVNESGTVIKLKGFNLGAWLLWEGWMWNDWNNPPEHRYVDSLTRYIGSKATTDFRNKIYENYITESDIKLMKNFGFNCVRLPVNYNFIFTNDGKQIKNGFQFLGNIIKWCEKNSIYLVFDLHAIPGSQVFETYSDSKQDSSALVWNNRDNRNFTINIWKTIAKKYRGKKIIAGFNIINEPVAPNNTVLIDFYNNIISGIREYDDNHIIFVDGNGYATGFDNFDKIEDKNIVLDAHRYSSIEIFPKEPLIQHVETSINLNKPVWLGEWGENSNNIIDSMISLLNNSNYNYSGWAYWPWKRTKLNDKNAPVTFEIKESWKIIKEIINENYVKNYSVNEIINSLDEFVESIKFENCKIDTSYIKLLAR